MWALLVVIPVMLLLSAAGATPAGRVFHALPLIGQLRAPARALGMVAFAVAALAAFGLTRLTQADTGNRRRSDLAALCCGMVPLAGVGIVLAFAARIDSTALGEDARFMFESALRLAAANALVPLLLALGTATLLAVLAAGRARRTMSAALVGLIAIDLGALAVTFNPTIAPDFARRVPGVVEFLRRELGDHRIAVIPHYVAVPPDQAAGALLNSWNMFFGIEEINGFNSLQPRRLVDMLSSRKSGDVTYGILHPARLREPARRVLDALAVRFALLQKGYDWKVPPGWDAVYEDEFVRAWRSPRDDPPRAFLAERLFVASSEDDAFEKFYAPDFDPTRDAVIEDPPAAVEALNVGMSGTVQRLSTSANAQTWRVQTSLPRVVVLSEMWYPGWQASYRASGSNDAWKSLHVLRANYLLRAIPVPAGDNEVRIRYRPMSAMLGLAISLLAIAGLAAAHLAQRRRRMPRISSTAFNG